MMPKREAPRKPAWPLGPKADPRDRVQLLPLHHVFSLVVHDLDIVDAFFLPSNARGRCGIC